MLCFSVVCRIPASTETNGSTGTSEVVQAFILPSLWLEMSEVKAFIAMWKVAELPNFL